MKQLRILLATSIIITLTIVLNSCHSKPVEIIFKTNQPDTSIGLNQQKVYVLKEQTTNSDFNYSKLKDIDGNTEDKLNIKNLMPIFEPINGNYNYYQFISTYKGYSFEDKFKNFHDILIIKTDNLNKIIDAYHYTLEWAELPLEYDLFKSSAKDINLKNNLDISVLKFKHFYYWRNYDIDLNERGSIKIK
jgi:hypothetical protein